MSLNLCHRTLRLDLNMKAIARKATEICLSIFRFLNDIRRNSSNQETRMLQTIIDSVSWLASSIQSGYTKIYDSSKHYSFRRKRSMFSHKYIVTVTYVMAQKFLQDTVTPVLSYCCNKTKILYVKYNQTAFHKQKMAKIHLRE